MNDKQANEIYRDELVKKLLLYLISESEDAMQVASNKVSFPFVNTLGNEYFIELTISIPKGSRDGTPYDAYELAVEYKDNVKRKAETAKRALELKQAKIKRDELARNKAKERTE